MRNHVRSFKTFIRDEIIKKGGWVNAHAHADRAFTMTPEKIGIYHNSNLQQKWDLVDEVNVHQVLMIITPVSVNRLN